MKQRFKERWDALGEAAWEMYMHNPEAPQQGGQEIFDLALKIINECRDTTNTRISTIIEEANK